MQLVLKFRNVLPTIVVEELDSIVATVRAYFGLEHKEDGTHGAIHCDSLTATGAVTADSIVGGNISGDLQIGPNIVIPGYIIASGNTITVTGTSPRLRLQETDQSVDQQCWDIVIDAQTFMVRTLTDTWGAMTYLLQLNRTTGEWRLSGAIRERNRTTPMGEWIDVPYSAANFAASGGPWTVEAADQAEYSYTLIGKTATVKLTVNTTTTTVASTYLRVTLPSGMNAAGQGGIGAVQNYLGSGVYDSGYCQALGAYIYIFRRDRVAYGVLTNVLNVTLTVTFEIA